MMASYYHLNAQANSHGSPLSHNSHHGGSRNRRAPRLSVSHGPQQRHLKGSRSLKEFNELALLSVFRSKFEAGRSFEIEDDMEYCPTLLTESDLVSISSGSERSSLASNSPESSPVQHSQTVAPGFSLNSTSPAFIPPSYQGQQHSIKLHQPSATRGRNAIPIVNPATGVTMTSPSPSVSPSMQQPLARRW